ncbi:DNA modification methylase [Halarchaeum acidiphilum MH1-52-1]|uniref:site-specific DNA-methyltransferase (cytosine-N(4)-specific) n=2 Tax=Halarchaeum acidiphilum TaxID=489138 RepID=U3A4D6_9EURY|nr:DNA methyltransferase [Halarchaeum acidiphilum]GAD52504.1 DNA modification methylase [Halarchaeum acidiphilum MH1-52-1]
MTQNSSSSTDKRTERKYSDNLFYSALKRENGEADTATIASHVGCTRRTAHNRLNLLANGDELSKRTVGGAILWRLDSLAIPQVDTSDLDQTWRSAPKRWSDSLHKIAPYVGGFPASLANYFIKRFTNSGDVVLDPFCGGGTAPLEALFLNRTAWASDAFSYAHTLTTAKCDPLPRDELTTYLDQKLDESDTIDNTNFRLLDNEDLHVFYSDYTLDQLLRLREVLADDTSREAMYLKALVCGVLHGPSEMFLSLSTRDTFSGSTDYVRRYAEKNNLERPERDIRDSVLRKQDLLERDPWPTNPDSNVVKADARDLPFENNNADLILTSPPYMRVLDYAWNNWIRLWWLNDDRDQERDKLDITASESKYRDFVRETLQEMERKLAPGGYIVLIVGDVRKNLTNHVEYINTAYLIAEEAADHTDLIPRQIINDDYDLDHRNYARANRLRYDYDKDTTEEKAMSRLDRCLILSNHDHQLPDSDTVDLAWDA